MAAKNKGGKKQKRYRSAGSGRFENKAAAKRWPKESVSEAAPAKAKTAAAGAASTAQQ